MLNNQRGISFIYILVTLVLIAFAGAGAYYLGTKNTKSPASSQYPIPNSTITPSPSLISSPTPSPSPNPTINPMLLENIKASVVSKNTAALEGYMVDTVSVTIEATECCGNLTKAKAISEMDYLNSAILPWNFNQSDPKISNIKQNYPQIFTKDSIIGIAANDLMVAFTLNNTMDKIAKIYMSASYKLLDNK